MCKVFPIDSAMEGVQDNKSKQNGVLSIECSNLLELSAADDLAGFVYEVEANGREIDEASFWYGRRMGTKKMGFDERTPLMVASTYGSIDVLKYIISTQKSEINRASATDGATALHCAAAGGSHLSVEAVKLLISSSADVNAVDSNGNRAADMIARYIKSSNSSKRKALEVLLNGGQIDEQEVPIEVAEQEEGEKQNSTAKKEYPIDVSLPDINNGVYGSDEFRMYSFKVKPCSRAYSHDWTECPFVHPGENARRRDPRKYNYSCVPCPEFRKGSCAKSDACEYAHGVFESWLHPAQYRTRLCKDETGCARKVCFFAHKVEELRPLYASTGSAMPSPKSTSSSSIEIGSMSPLVLSGSTPPMSPSSVSSPLGGGSLWQNKVNLTPPTLQLPGSRLKTALNARDLELELELLGLESIRTQQRQQLIDDLSATLASSSPSYYNNNSTTRFGELKPTNLDDVFGSLDHSSAAMLSQLQSLSLSSPNLSSSTIMATTSPTVRQNSNPNPLRASYPSSNYSSSPVRKPNPNASFGFDSSAAVAQAVMNSRSAAFAKRSQSFVHRGGPVKAPSNLSEWGSPDGKLDWGFNGEEASKLKKSASFGFRNGGGGVAAVNGGSGLQQSQSGGFLEPDVSWVNTLVKDVSSVGAGLYSSEPKNGGNVQEMMMPPWIEQMYIEQEQMVA